MIRPDEKVSMADYVSCIGSLVLIVLCVAVAVLGTGLVS